MLDRANDFTRRKEARTQKTLSLSFKEKESFIKAYSDNISGGGLFIRTKRPLEQGDPFSLKLQIPGMDEPLKINCEVCWSRPESEEADNSPAGMGIQFMDMSEGDRETLDQFIKEISAEADTFG
jgi:type IV pilus assembly protein PilZ